MVPSFLDLQAARTNSGRPRSSVRLRTVTAILVFDLLRRPGMGGGNQSWVKFTHRPAAALNPTIRQSWLWKSEQRDK